MFQEQENFKVNKNFENDKIMAKNFNNEDIISDIYMTVVNINI